MHNRPVHGPCMNSSHRPNEDRNDPCQEQERRCSDGHGRTETQANRFRAIARVRRLPPSACGGFVDVEVRPPTTSKRMKPRPRRRPPTASHREKRKRFRHTKTQGSAAAKPVRMATLTSRRALWRGDERSDSQMNGRTPSQSLSPQIVGDDPAANC